MVDLVASFVLNATGTWGRQIITTRLRNGGAFAQSLSNIIEREMCTIKRQLEALTRKDLDESIDLFLEGLASYYLQANDNKADAGPQSPQRKKMKTISHVKVDEIDASEILDARKSLSVETKERFKDARKKAGSAIANEAMTTKDVILATLIKLLSQMLETDDLAAAFSFCLDDLKQLHLRKDVKKNFEDVLAKKKRWLMTAKVRKEAAKIAWCVCLMNQFVFNMAQEAGEAKRSPESFKPWPCVKIASHLRNHLIEIDPLRDPELSAIFESENLKFSPIPPSSFGQNDAAEELKPQKPGERAEATPSPSLRITGIKRTAKKALIFETPETWV